ncbi:MAG: c-type cytochrome [Gammaproteobacteria bacterium]
MKRGRCSLAILCLAVAALAGAESPSSPREDASTLGKKVFTNQCALCHGIDGEGGRGPALNKAKLARAATQADLVKLIQEGIPGTEMSASWMLSEKEVEQVAAYVLSLGHMPREALRGDAARGKTLYETKGKCGACHIIDGVGGIAGPSLNDVGARRSASHIRAVVLEPNTALPEGFLVVTVTTVDGKRIRGERVNEDPFTLQLRDSDGRFHSFRKAEVKDLTKELGVSTMPAYKDVFTSAELEDLVAYLASLEGVQ